MKFKKFSPETVAELLIHLAEKENFDSLKGITEFSKKDVQKLFAEIADQLKELSENEPHMRKEHVSQKDLTDNVYKVISRLSPQEENLLFKTFKIS